MKKILLLHWLFSVALISCDHEPILTDGTDPIPTESEKYESKGYYLDGHFGDREIMVKDTFYTVVGSTNGASSNGKESDSVTLSYGIEFRAMDATGKPLETFKIELKKNESKVNLDSKYNYKDLGKISEVITEGRWEFCYNEAMLNDKGVSVSYMDHGTSISKWFTESLYDQMFDYTSFEFNLEKVVNNVDDKILVIEGSLECVLYNLSNPIEQKTLIVKFRGPINYYVE